MNKEYENNNYEQDNTPEPVDHIEDIEMNPIEHTADEALSNRSEDIFSTTEQPSVEHLDIPIDENQQTYNQPYTTPTEQPVPQTYSNPQNTGYYGTYHGYNNGQNNYNGYSNANNANDYNHYSGVSNNGYPYNQEQQAPYAQPYDGADNQYQSSPFHNSPNSPNPQFSAVPSPKVAKERKHKNHGMKIAAIALVCALAGGAVGGISTYAIIANAKSGGTSLNNPGTVQNVKIDDTYNSSVEAIAAKVLPSVVGIQSTFRTTTTSMFGNQTGEATSEGSGIVYREDGYIITNYHVVEGASTNGTITVYLDETTEEGYKATVVGYDAGADLAVLKIDKTGLTPIDIADSEKINVGQVAVAIGNPGGLQFMGSVSQGIVSGLNRTITLESGVSMNLIQTDAAINPGNSGGALVDGTGKLIGVNSAKLASSGSPTSGGTNYEGMGFAIPVNDVVEICERLISNQGKKAAYLGITIDPRYTAQALEQMGYPSGVVLASVVEGGPAAQAGLQISDIITSIEGTPVVSYELLVSELTKYSPGETVELEIYRLSQTHKIKVTLGETSEQS